MNEVNDDAVDRRPNALDQPLAEHVETTNICGVAAQQETARVHRYLLEQKFFGDNNKIEKYATAVVSIIGSEPLDEFDDCLAKLSYEYSPWCACPHIASKWVGNATSVLPEYYMGVMSVATLSPASLVALKEEMQRYKQAGVFAIIGLPPDANFASLMKRTLEDFGEDAHFVQLANGSDLKIPPIRSFSEVAIDYIQAILVASTYPGLVCVDQTDAITTYSHGKSTVITRYEASSFDEILRIGYARLSSNVRHVGVMASLFAPRSLGLKDVYEVMDLVRERLSNDRNTVVFAAVGDEKRDRFVFYVTVSE